MVRISIDLINNSYQFINAVNQREITLRNLQIPTIENLGVTKVFIILILFFLIFFRINLM